MSGDHQRRAKVNQHLGNRPFEVFSVIFGVRQDNVSRRRTIFQGERRLIVRSIVRRILREDGTEPSIGKAQENDIYFFHPKGLKYTHSFFLAFHTIFTVVLRCWMGDMLLHLYALRVTIPTSHKDDLHRTTNTEHSLNKPSCP